VVCVCVCLMCVCVVCVCVRACAHVCMCECVCARTCACACVLACTCVRACVSVNARACERARVCVCVCVCVRALRACVRARACVRSCVCVCVRMCSWRRMKVHAASFWQCTCPFEQWWGAWQPCRRKLLRLHAGLALATCLNNASLDRAQGTIKMERAVEQRLQRNGLCWLVSHPRATS